MNYVISDFSLLFKGGGDVVRRVGEFFYKQGADIAFGGGSGMNEKLLAVVVAGELVIFCIGMQRDCLKAFCAAFVYYGFQKSRAYARIVDFGVYAESVNVGKLGGKRGVAYRTQNFPVFFRNENAVVFYIVFDRSDRFGQRFDGRGRMQFVAVQRERFFRYFVNFFRVGNRRFSYRGHIILFYIRSVGTVARSNVKFNALFRDKCALKKTISSKDTLRLSARAGGFRLARK